MKPSISLSTGNNITSKKFAPKDAKGAELQPSVAASGNSAAVLNTDFKALLGRLETAAQSKGDLKVKPTSWAQSHGINAALGGKLGNIAHIINPDSSSIFTPASYNRDNARVGTAEYIKMISGYVAGGKQIANGFIHQDGGALKKPVVMVWNTASAKAASAVDSSAVGGRHWQTCVILPRNYITFAGENINNPNELVFFVDSLYENQAIPEVFQHILTNKITYKFDAGRGEITHQLGGAFPNANFIRCNPKQQAGGEDCGWWAVYNAMMIVLTGKTDFLNQFQVRSRLPAYALRTLFPDLERGAVIGVGNNASKDSKPKDKSGDAESRALQQAIENSLKTFEQENKNKGEQISGAQQSKGHANVRVMELQKSTSNLPKGLVPSIIGRRWVKSLEVEHKGFVIPADKLHAELRDATIEMEACDVERSKNYLSVSFGIIAYVAPSRYNFYQEPLKIPNRSLVGADVLNVAHKHNVEKSIQEGAKLKKVQYNFDGREPYHTEQILYEYLNNNTAKVINGLVTKLKEQNLVVVERIVLDMHSKLPMCLGCELSSIYILHNKELLKKFIAAFKQNAIGCSQDLEIVIRFTNHINRRNAESHLYADGLSVMNSTTQNNLAILMQELRGGNSDKSPQRFAAVCKSTTVLRSGDGIDKGTKKPLVKGLFESALDSKNKATLPSDKLAKLVHTDEVTKFKDADKEFKNRTYLHQASQDGNVDMVKLLTTTSADKNSVDEYGFTPAHLATLDNKGKGVAILTELANAGADLSRRNMMRQTPLQMAVNIKTQHAIEKILPEKDKKTYEALYANYKRLIPEYKKSTEFMQNEIWPFIQEAQKEILNILETIDLYRKANENLVKNCIIPFLISRHKLKKLLIDMYNYSNGPSGDPHWEIHNYIFGRNNPNFWYNIKVKELFLQAASEAPKFKDTKHADKQKIDEQLCKYFEYIDKYLSTIHPAFINERKLSSAMEWYQIQIDKIHNKALRLLPPFYSIDSELFLFLTSKGVSINELSHLLVDAVGARGKMRNNWWIENQYTDAPSPDFKDVHAHSELIIKSLVRAGMSIDYSSNGYTALAKALYHVELNMVKFLLSLGANADSSVQTIDGRIVSDHEDKASSKIKIEKYLDRVSGIILHSKNDESYQIIKALVMSGSEPSSLGPEKIVKDIEKYIVILKFQMRLIEKYSGYIQCYDGLRQKLINRYEQLYPNPSKELEDCQAHIKKYEVEDPISQESIRMQPSNERYYRNLFKHIEKYQQRRATLFGTLSALKAKEAIHERIKHKAEANHDKYILKDGDYDLLKEFEQFQKAILIKFPEYKQVVIKFQIELKKLDSKQKEELWKLRDDASKFLKGKGTLLSAGFANKDASSLSKEEMKNLANKLYELLEMHPAKDIILGLNFDTLMKAYLLLHEKINELHLKELAVEMEKPIAKVSASIATALFKPAPAPINNSPTTAIAQAAGSGTSLATGIPKQLLGAQSVKVGESRALEEYVSKEKGENRSLKKAKID